MDTLFTALRVAVSLAVIVALLLYVQRRSAKWARGKAGRPITVVGKQSLGGKARVVIVEADGSRFVLGVTDSSVVVLNARETASFADALAGAGADALAGAGAGAGAGAEEDAAETGPAAAPTPSAHVRAPKPTAVPTPVPVLTRPRDSASRGRRAARPGFAESITSAETWKKAAMSLRNSP